MEATNLFDIVERVVVATDKIEHGLHVEQLLDGARALTSLYFFDNGLSDMLRRIADGEEFSREEVEAFRAKYQASKRDVVPAMKKVLELVHSDNTLIRLRDRAVLDDIHHQKQFGWSEIEQLIEVVHKSTFPALRGGPVEERLVQARSVAKRLAARIQRINSHLIDVDERLAATTRAPAAKRLPWLLRQLAAPYGDVLWAIAVTFLMGSTLL